MSRRLLSWTAAVVVLGAAACRADDPCAPAGSACGGDPSGNWTVAGSCQEATFAPPQPLTYYGQPSNMARQPPPEGTSSDWCSYLVYDPVRGVTNFVFPYDALTLIGGTVDYDASDGLFAAILNMTGVGAIDLSGSCLSRFAVVPSCETLTTDLTTFAATEPSFQNIACVSDGRAGCHCSYTITFLPSGGPLSGRWGAAGSLLTHFAGSKQLPSQADFCVDANDRLTLWGHDRTDLWDLPGLRTLSLTRLP